MTVASHLEGEQLTESENEFLAGVRRVMGPDSGDRARVRLAISASLEGELGVPSLTAGASAQPGGNRVRGIAGVGRQVVGALLIGSLGFGLGFLTAQSRMPAGIVSTGAPSSATLGRAAGSAPADSIPVVSEASTATSAARKGSSKVRATDARMLSEEAEALRRVGRALRDGDPGLAKQILDDLDVRIPHGTLTEERQAAGLMVRCRNGDALASEAARAWLKRHTRSVYAPRVRASCDIDVSASSSESF